jgi:hypothetical protein
VMIVMARGLRLRNKHPGIKTEVEFSPKKWIRFLEFWASLAEVEVNRSLDTS